MKLSLWTALTCFTTCALAQSEQHVFTTATATTLDVMNLEQAIQLLTLHGVPQENLCTGDVEYSNVEDISSPLPLCSTINIVPQKPQSWVRSRRERYLAEEPELEGEESDWFYITHAICALICVSTAALAAGLTMGLLSLDPLMLLIKMRAGATPKEQAQAASLLPIVKQHHLLLVTLLLLNSMANEALPLFLEVLVSPLVAVLLSVTLVLFFGEIIPSAIFTGPNKVDIAARLVPVVKVVMFLLYPLSFPIAKLLDVFLHEEEDGGEGAFDRGELSALVRIQYEERMAHKQRKKEEKRQFQTLRQETSDVVDNVGGLDFASRQMIKASKRKVGRFDDELSMSSRPIESTQTSRDDSTRDGSVISAMNPDRRISIHVDEVNMVEGALSMKTKVALDVYTPLHRMFAVSHDMVLNEANVVKIYSSGFSRIPVFVPNPAKPKSVTGICGVLITKQLMLVNTTEERSIMTLPLAVPRCVSPKMNLVDLLNLFQTGRVGHLALVCARPKLGQELLLEGRPLTEAAGLMGIITLEDVLESLLQEEIYDESDKKERKALRLSRMGWRRWRNYVKRRRMEREKMVHTSLGQVVNQAMEAHERTSLLGAGSAEDQQSGFDPLGSFMGLLSKLSGGDDDEHGNQNA
eukprot:Nitzschia sp. Nitz4//scaffold47_size129522//9375//11285//NITZ4_003533-RA/size129522-processed-gene-0.28-mRNA-1//-1//CDS//3329552746//7391//frame0